MSPQQAVDSKLEDLIEAAFDTEQSVIGNMCKTALNRGDVSVFTYHRYVMTLCERCSQGIMNHICEMSSTHAARCNGKSTRKGR